MKFSDFKFSHYACNVWVLDNTYIYHPDISDDECFEIIDDTLAKVMDKDDYEISFGPCEIHNYVYIKTFFIDLSSRSAEVAFKLLIET